MKPPTVNLQLRIQPWLSEAIDDWVGSYRGTTRAEVARHLLHLGYVKAKEIEQVMKETAVGE
jgi:hypothetical protein